MDVHSPAYCFATNFDMPSLSTLFRTNRRGRHPSSNTLLTACQQTKLQDQDVAPRPLLLLRRPSVCQPSTPSGFAISIRSPRSLWRMEGKVATERLTVAPHPPHQRDGLECSGSKSNRSARRNSSSSMEGIRLSNIGRFIFPLLLCVLVQPATAEQNATAAGSASSNPRLLPHLPLVRQVLAAIPGLFKGLIHGMFALLHLLRELDPLDPAMWASLLLLAGFAWTVWRLFRLLLATSIVQRLLQLPLVAQIVLFLQRLPAAWRAVTAAAPAPAPPAVPVAAVPAPAFAPAVHATVTFETPQRPIAGGRLMDLHGSEPPSTPVSRFAAYEPRTPDRHPAPLGVTSGAKSPALLSPQLLWKDLDYNSRRFWQGGHDPVPRASSDDRSMLALERRLDELWLSSAGKGKRLSEIVPNPGSPEVPVPAVLALLNSLEAMREAVFAYAMGTPSLSLGEMQFLLQSFLRRHAGARWFQLVELCQRKPCVTWSEVTKHACSLLNVRSREEWEGVFSSHLHDSAAIAI